MVTQVNISAAAAVNAAAANAANVVGDATKINFPNIIHQAIKDEAL